jgi:hypothetical protein
MPRLLFALALVPFAVAPLCAHVLGGGGRPASSSGSSSGESGAAGAGSGSAGDSNAAWNKLDPPAASGVDASETDARFRQMNANCAAIPDAGARATCEASIGDANARMRSFQQSLNAVDAEKKASAAGGAGGTPLDRARSSEVERLNAARGRCDAMSGTDAQVCYEQMDAEHEAWHDRFEPMEAPDDPAYKKQREARAKCLKLPDAAKRKQCLKDLVRKRNFKKGLAPAPR